MRDYVEGGSKKTIEEVKKGEKGSRDVIYILQEGRTFWRRYSQQRKWKWEKRIKKRKGHK